MRSGLALEILFLSGSETVSLAITRPTGCDFRKFRKIDFPYFFVKKSGKIRKIVFLDSWDQNKILKFLIFFSKLLYMASISYINPYLRAPRPLKPLKSRPQGQNLPGDLLRAHSDHRGPVSDQFCPLCCLLLTLS